MNHLLITVPFHQQRLFVVEKNGRRWVAMKPICEAIGIDWDSQRKRIKRDPILSSVAVMMTATGADGKQYEMLFLDLDYLNGWLFGIDANRVMPELRERVIEYQRECYKVLAGYFHAKEQWALSKAEARNQKAEAHYFARYPERRQMRALALAGEPFWFIGHVVGRAPGTVSRAIRDMLAGGYLIKQQLDTARIGIAHWSRHRRKFINQLSFGF